MRAVERVPRWVVGAPEGWTYLGVTFSPRGRKRLKGISEPIGLYRVTPVEGDVGVSRRRALVRRWPKPGRSAA